MTTKIAINGLGRIGRCVLRAVFEEGYDDIEIVALNGPAPTETHLHLLKYDSVHGRFNATLEGDEHSITINDKEIPLMHHRDPDQLNWNGADIVLECTGKFRTRDDAAIHLGKGAKKVLISAPSPDTDATIVYGVNNNALKPEHDVISVGSCTTNGLAPIAQVLNNIFGIESGFMTTIHAYTGDQNIVDGSHKDMYRARGAALSMIPTSTGAAKAIGVVLPELKGKLNGTAVRVPTPNVSMVDLTFTSSKSMSVEAINEALTYASENELKGVLDVTNEPLVSIDLNHSPASSTADLNNTFVTGNHFGRVASWYDNEWGFSCRMLDVARIL
jgi:glyceraldehyde 3-phosphate dehydrogenase